MGVNIMNKDKEFLAKLVELAKTYGWLGDYIEVSYFVEWVFDEMGEDCPDLEPFPEGYNDFN